MKVCKKGHPPYKLGSGCPSCKAEYKNRWNNANRELVRQVNKVSSLRYFRKHTAKIRSKRLQKLYGITLAEYDLMFESQDGKCAICNLPESEMSKSGYLKPLAVDHCHTTNKIRSLLCSQCNKAIGAFKDSPDLCIKAAEYLSAKK